MVSYLKIFRDSKTSLLGQWFSNRCALLFSVFSGKEEGEVVNAPGIAFSLISFTIFIKSVWPMKGGDDLTDLTGWWILKRRITEKE